MSSDTQLVLGFDFGTTRIGLAIGQSLTASANPIDPIRARDGMPDWDALDHEIGRASCRERVYGTV